MFSTKLQKIFALFGARSLYSRQFVPSVAGRQLLTGREGSKHDYCSSTTAKVLIASLTMCGVSLAECDSSNEPSSSDPAADQPQKSPEVTSVIGKDELFNGPEDEEYWEKSKRECSFCNMFLSSPCKEEFKLWSKCVDTAKARGVDFTAACQPYSRALMNCTMSHPEHFPSAPEKEDDVEGEDDDEVDEGGSAMSAQDEGQDAATTSKEEASTSDNEPSSKTV